MKKTWVVYVQMGIGHELNNTVSESEWYGPYTETQAKALENRLCKLFRQQNVAEHGEIPEAIAMPLEPLTTREVFKKYSYEGTE